jgi:hypothetical protein
MLYQSGEKSVTSFSSALCALLPLQRSMRTIQGKPAPQVIRSGTGVIVEGAYTASLKENQ